MASSTPYSGRSHYLLVGKETSYGTTITANKDLGDAVGGTIRETWEYEDVPAEGSRNLQHIAPIRYVCGGTVDVKYQHARLLEYALGTVSDSGTTDPYTHTFGEANTVPSFTLEDGYSLDASSGIAKRFTGCKIDNLRITHSRDASLQMSADWVGKTVATTTSAQAAVLSSLSVLPHVYGLVTIGTDEAEPTTGTQYDLRSSTINIANGLEPVYSDNASTLTQLVEAGRRYTGDLSIAFENDDTYQRFLGSTDATGPQSSPDPIALRLYYTDGGTPERSFKVVLYGVKITDSSNPITGGGGVIYQDFTFRAKSLGTCVSKDNIQTLNP